MHFSLRHTFAVLVVAALSISEGRCAAPAGPRRHLEWLDLPPKFTFNAPIDNDVAILNASMGHSFRFIDFNTTDTELLLSPVSGRQALHNVPCLANVCHCGLHAYLSTGFTGVSRAVFTWRE
jgi:hypothetical protein